MAYFHKACQDIKSMPPKFPQLATKHSNVWDYRRRGHSKHHSIFWSYLPSQLLLEPPLLHSHITLWLFVWSFVTNLYCPLFLANMTSVECGWCSMGYIPRKKYFSLFKQLTMTNGYIAKVKIVSPTFTSTVGFC